MEHTEVNVRPKVEFESFVWERRLYEEARIEMGMEELMFFEPGVEDLELVEGADVDVWRDVMKVPYCILCIAVKSHVR